MLGAWRENKDRSHFPAFRAGKIDAQCACFLPSVGKSTAIWQDARRMRVISAVEGEICSKCARLRCKTQPRARISRDSRHIVPIIATKARKTRIRCISRRKLPQKNRCRCHAQPNEAPAGWLKCSVKKTSQSNNRSPKRSKGTVIFGRRVSCRTPPRKESPPYS